jgi:hypothetical protein
LVELELKPPNSRLRRRCNNEQSGHPLAFAASERNGLAAVKNSQVLMTQDREPQHKQTQQTKEKHSSLEGTAVHRRSLLQGPWMDFRTAKRKETKMTQSFAIELCD